MTLSVYQATVPVFTRALTNLRAVLQKAHDHALTQRIEPSILLSSRLYPNMYPLTRQVQIAADGAKFCLARMVGVEPPRDEDVETTFDELYARIDKTLAYLQGFDAAQLEGSEARTVTLSEPSGKHELLAKTYLLDFALPNFYFHATMAYAILRHNGVELGKFDYLGRLA